MSDHELRAAWKAEFVKRGMLGVLEDLHDGVYGAADSPKHQAAHAWIALKRETIALEHDQVERKVGFTDSLLGLTANEIALQNVRWAKWIVLFTGATAVAAIIGAAATILSLFRN